MKDEMNSELKPCPFCGGNAELTTDHHDYSNGEHTSTYGVNCTKCFIEPQRLQSPESAILTWNTRHDNTQELKEALQGLVSIFAHTNYGWAKNDIEKAVKLLNTQTDK